MKQTILWKQQGPVVIFVNITLYNGFKLMREQEGGGGGSEGHQMVWLV